jgi:cell division septum initiation protein DivIVA
VSAFEPHMPSEPKVDMPDFMVVLRGFDRRQVEMWAAEVASQIEQERLRADEAEKRAYRVEIDNKGAASFSHLGTHVASILEEAGRSSENMLADAADRAQETVEAAEEEAAEIIKAAEHRAGEIEGDARHILDEARSEGARVEEDALQAAEEMRAQAEQDARTVLEEARDATDMIWQEAERERIGVEAETIRLETLRHRSLEQLGRVYGHLESVLDEVRAGIGRVEEEQEDLDEATAAAAARLGVEPPASSPEESPRFPDLRPQDRTVAGDLTAGDDSVEPGPADDPGELTAGGDLRDRGEPSDRGDLGDRSELSDLGDRSGSSDRSELSDRGDLGDGGKLAEGGDSMLSATRPGTAGPARPGTVGRPEQPALSDAVDESADGSPSTDAEATQPALASTDAEGTQPALASTTAETTQPTPADDPAATTQPTPPTANGATGPANGEAEPDPDATQRLEPVGNTGPKSRLSKPASKESKDRP